MDDVFKRAELEKVDNGYILRLETRSAINKEGTASSFSKEIVLVSNKLQRALYDIRAFMLADELKKGT